MINCSYFTAVCGVGTEALPVSQEAAEEVDAGSSARVGAPRPDFVPSQAQGEHSPSPRYLVLRIIPQNTPHLESKAFLSHALVSKQDVFAGGF